jgi:transposase
MTDEQAKELIREVKRLRKENELLRQKLDAMARRLFGRKSEQLDSNQLEFLLGQLEEAEQPSASGEAVSPEADTKPRRKASPRKPRCPDDLPVETEIIDPPPVSENPSLFRQIGEEVSEQIDYEPGRFLKRRTVRRTWVKRSDPDAVPMTAELPPKLLERGILAPGLLAHILISKYADHLPLYRQQGIFEQRHGVYLPRQTLARGVELAADWLRPIVNQILAEQLASGYVQIDETPVKYLSPGEGRSLQGYFWAVKTPALAGKPGADTVYHWTPGRGHEALLAILPEDFEGMVQCDGYGAYRTMSKKRPGVRLVGCWAHARRKFHEAFEQRESPVRSAWVLRQIGHLYRVEGQLRESRAGPNLRAAVRATQSRPILHRLHTLFIQIQAQHRPQSLMGKAINYALGQWAQLEVYLEDGHLEIDNNPVENAIRPAALGRKNWLFIGAEEAGWRSAVVYSIIQSCKAHSVEPYTYLKDVLTRLPSMTNRQIPSLTPRAWAATRKEALLLAS